MSDDKLLGRIKKMLQIDPGKNEWLDVETIERALEVDRTPEKVPFREEAQDLVRLFAAPSTTKQKMIDVVTWFNDQFFREYVEISQSRTEAWIKANETPTRENSRRALDQLSHDGYDSLLANCPRISLFPVTDNTSSNIWTMLPGNAYIVFNIAYADRVLLTNRETPVYQTLTAESIEALSDVKRIAILRLLRKRPHYGREIAEELGVSASTASYHIEKLVSARLLRLQLSEGRRFYYAINNRGARELLARIESEFIVDEDSWSV